MEGGSFSLAGTKVADDSRIMKVSQICHNAMGVLYRLTVSSYLQSIHLSMSCMQSAGIGVWQYVHDLRWGGRAARYSARFCFPCKSGILKA